MTRFIRKAIDSTPIVDNVFAVVDLAKKAKEQLGKEVVIDATIGALYDEDEQLVAFRSVYHPYNEIESKIKANYAESFSGNPAFRKQVYKWVVQQVDLHLAHTTIATPGGSGAVSTTINNILDQKETLIIPDIAWGSYRLMATMNNMDVETYSLFDGDHFNITSFKEVCQRVMDRQKKILVIINDPCHNPTGYSLSKKEWEEVIYFLNECGEQGPVVILNDIAYIDYSYDFENSRNYLETFNAINKHVLIVVAFSSSKTLTSYGLRCGAALIMAQCEESVRQLEIVMEKSARAIWSNIPNAAMENLVYVTTKGVDAYLEEKDYFVSLLEKRSKLFLQEAKEVGLQHYPYKEGFFVTLKVEDKDLCTKLHKACIEEHIYTVQVNKGIRIALCSLKLEKTKGLAKRIKEIFDTLS